MVLSLRWMNSTPDYKDVGEDWPTVRSLGADSTAAPQIDPRMSRKDEENTATHSVALASTIAQKPSVLQRSSATTVKIAKMACAETKRR